MLYSSFYWYSCFGLWRTLLPFILFKGLASLFSHGWYQRLLLDSFWARWKLKPWFDFYFSSFFSFTSMRGHPLQQECCELLFTSSWRLWHLTYKKLFQKGWTDILTKNKFYWRKVSSQFHSVRCKIENSFSGLDSWKGVLHFLSCFDLIILCFCYYSTVTKAEVTLDIGG